MTNQAQSSNSKYDLQERTAKFGESVIDMVRPIQSSPILTPLISQIVRSATSIGANYMEADAADSKKDFRHKISLCKKECKGTLHWLRMFSHAAPSKIEECRKLWKEAHELTLIFSSIMKK